jgi:hypothetical protein
MSPKLIRCSLWVACAFNLLAAGIFAVPSSSAGQLLELPREGSSLYSVLVAFFIALFGVVYAWLALQPGIVRPLLYLGALGKLAAFLLALALWLARVVAVSFLLASLGDLAFAALWLTWLRSTATR